MHEYTAPGWARAIFDISRYPEWGAYARQSNRLVPFKRVALLSGSGHHPSATVN
jgi:hypothetical protein